MALITLSSGLKVLDHTPDGDAGQALQDNFTILNNVVEALIAPVVVPAPQNLRVYSGPTMTSIYWTPPYDPNNQVSGFAIFHNGYHLGDADAGDSRFEAVDLGIGIVNQFDVFAYDSQGNRSIGPSQIGWRSSNEAEPSTSLAPAPEIIRVWCAGTRRHLVWMSDYSNQIAGYRVHRIEGDWNDDQTAFNYDEDSDTLIYEGNATSFADDDEVAGDITIYSVECVDGSGHSSASIAACAGNLIRAGS